jgi:cytochrome c oxidase subunit 4
MTTPKGDVTASPTPEPAAAVTAHDAAAHASPNYMFIWLVLADLTAAEVGIAFVTAIPKLALILILIAMAIWKAVLVALYYMHLKFEPQRLKFIVLAPLPLAVILVVIVLAEKW